MLLHDYQAEAMELFLRISRHCDAKNSYTTSVHQPWSNISAPNMICNILLKSQFEFPTQPLKKD